MTLYKQLLSHIHSQGEKSLILVENQLMERRLRTRLQNEFHFFAPTIKTVDTWIKEIILRHSSLDFPQFYERILSPKERAYALTEWQQTNKQERFVSASDRAMVLKYVSELNRAQRTADDFFQATKSHKKQIFPKLLKDFEDFLQRQKWLDRERIAGLHESLNHIPSTFSHIVLFDLQEGSYLRKVALQKMKELSEAQQISWAVIVGDSQLTIKIDSVSAKSYHTAVDEFTHIFDEIGIAVSENPEVNFSDFVILCPRIDDVRLSIDIARQFTEVPIYITKPQNLSSHPISQRVLALFSLGLSSTEIDDLLLVFEDNLLFLPFFSGTKVEKLNLRSVKTFCRENNLRTFSELVENYEALLTNNINRNDRLNDEQKAIRLKEELSFLSGTISAIQSILKTFNRPATSISAWIDECFIPLLSRQEKYSDEVITSLMTFIKSTLENFSNSHTSLQFNRKVSYDDAIELVKTLFAETSEPLADHPFAITITEPGYFTLLDDKSVYFTGLSDGFFPRITKTDYVRFTYANELNSLLSGRTLDEYGRDERVFNNVLTHAKKVSLSYSRKSGGRDTNPSPFLVDWLKGAGYTKKDGSIAVPDGSKDGLSYTKNSARPHSKEELNAKEIHSKRLWDRLGIYDGVLSSPDLAPSPEIQKELARWTERNKAYLTVSDLNAYIKNPLHFFFEKVLGLSPVAQYQDDVEMDTRGLIIHEIAEQFFGKSNNGDLISPWDDDFLQKAKPKLEADINFVYEKFAGQMGNERTVIPDLLRSKIRMMFFKWLEVHNEAMENVFLQQLTPVGVEEKHDLSLEQEFDFKVSGISFKGKIDRIDTNETTKAAFVIDYKSGSNAPNAKTILAGGDMQIPVYMKFLMTQGYNYFAGGYWKLNPSKQVSSSSLSMALADDDLIHDTLYLTNKGTRRANAFSLEKEKREKFLDFLFEYRIQWLDAAIKKGIFNPSFNGGGSYNQEIHWISRSHLPFTGRAHSELKENLTDQGELNHFYQESDILKFVEKGE